jgi:hypothetical protein
MAVERAGGVVRITGPFNFVTAWDLTADTARAAVASATLWMLHPPS